MNNNRLWKAKEIQMMSYNEIIGVVRETNRPPGGRKSIREIVHRSFLTAESRVLDIGTSTGATALEIARLIRCNVVGIDINEESLKVAGSRAKELRLMTTQFKKANAMELPFPESSFDLVFCGNVTSLVKDRFRAISEYVRVLNAGGYLAAIPMYYIEEPSKELVNKVSEAIQVDISVSYREDAIALYKHESLEFFDELHFRFCDVSVDEINTFCDGILSQRHLLALDAETREILEVKYREYMLLFRKNLQHMGYTILLQRKSPVLEEPELFIGCKLG